MKEYIERNEAVNELNKIPAYFDNGDICYGVGVSIREIKKIPAADIKEVVHAKWEMVVDDFDDGFGERKYPFCSNCHKGVYRHDAKNWCPNCGAKMDL